MPHLTGLRVRNWQRFRGEHELELGPGVYALVATSKEDPRRSNWSGKSSLLAAIRWLLFGSKVMDVDALDDLVSHGEAELSVEGEFSDGTFVSRQRRRGKQQRDLVFERGEVKAAGDGAQELIERYVGLGEEELLTTAWSEQGDMARLARTKSTALSATVRGWARLERLERAGELAEDAFGKAAEELKAKLLELERLESTGGDPLLRACEVTVAREQALFEAQEERRRGLVAERSAWRAWQRYDELLEEKRQAAERVSRLKSILGGLGAVDPEVLSKAEREMDAKVRVLVAAEAEAKRARVLTVEEFDGACPVSRGFECPAKQQINSRGEENRETSRAASEAKRRAAALESDARTLLVNLRSGAERRLIAESELASAEAALARANDKEIAYKPIADRPEVDCQDPPPLSRTELELAERALKAAKQASAALPRARADVEQARLALSVAKAAARVLGPEGALKRASEGAVELVAREANRVLAESGVELSIQVSWSRETGKPAEHCHDCGLAFPASARVKQCAGCGRERGMKARHDFRFRGSDRSGAADDLVGLGLRCGAARYLASTREVGLSLALFDEPLAQCDLAHREAVSRHLMRMLGGSFEQVIVADHHAGFMDGLPRAIVVVADGKWSRLEVRG